MLGLILAACISSAPAPDTVCPDGSHLEADGLCHLDDSGSASATGDALSAGGAESPDWTADEALAQLDTAFAGGMVGSIEIFEAYDLYMSQRDNSCPPMQGQDTEGSTGQWSTDGCTTATGWSFTGLARHQGGCGDGSDNHEDPGTAQLELGLLAQFAMGDPDGIVFEGGGSAALFCRWYTDGSGSCSDKLGGSFVHHGAGTWLGSGASASLFVDHLWGGADGRVTTMEGGISYSNLDISLAAVRLDWDRCEGGATGMLRLRDPTGYWHELTFDDDCSGCGSMRWRDEDEGRRCVDLAAAFRPVVDAWEQPCWE